MNLSASQKFGLAAEEWVTRQLLAQGYPAKLVSQYFSNHDIRIGPLAVEVKAARPKPYQSKPGVWRYRWQFDTSRPLKGVDFIYVLVCSYEGRLYPYICPSWEIFGRSTVQITSPPPKYRGRLAGNLFQWPNIDRVMAEVQKRNQQLPLLQFEDNLCQT